MTTNRAFCGAVLLWVSVIGLSSCSGAPPTATDQKIDSGLPALKQAVAAASGYPSDALEVMVGGAHLRLTVSDAKLSGEDQAARERSATAMVLALEQAMAGQAGMNTVQEISIAIVHPTPDGDADKDSHVEDVLSFRKGPAGRFAHHAS